MSNCLRRLCLLAVLLGCLAASADAQEAKRDPKVQAVIDQMMAAYKGLTALHVKINFKVSANAPASFQEGMPDSIELRFQKPNKLWLDIVEKKAGKTARQQVVSNGANLWRWQSATNAYTKTKAPNVFHEISDLPDAAPEVALLQEKDPFKEFPPNTPLTLGAPTKVGDVDVDVLETKIAEQSVSFNATVKMLIGQKDHLIRGVTFEGNGKDPMSGKEMNIKFEIAYSLVNPAPTFTPADFTFTPPPGAKPAATGAPAKPKPGAKPKSGGRKGKKG